MLASSRTCAGARVHAGILFSSVKIENKSSAEAWNAASTFTVAVLTALGSAFFAAGFDAAEAAAGVFWAAVDAPAGAGVTLRLGSALTVRSLPCVLMMADGNSENLASSATGRRAFASANSASTAGVRAVVRDQFH